MLLRGRSSGDGLYLISAEFSGCRPQPHVVAPDVGTPAVLFASANHPRAFKSMVIGSGATDHTNIGGILDELVNAPSLEPYKSLTGEEFVRGATENMKKYKLPDYALQDYL